LVVVVVVVPPVVVVVGGGGVGAMAAGLKGTAEMVASQMRWGSGREMMAMAPLTSAARLMPTSILRPEIQVSMMPRPVSSTVAVSEGGS